MRFVVSAVIGAALTISLPAARADDVAAAEAAFLRGKELLRTGKTAEACTAFALSQRLDPQFGTQYNLALCYEQLGKVASAWTVFRELAQRDSNASRRQDSARRAEQLAPAVSKLLVTVREPVPGLRITRSGVDVTLLVGVEDPVDPGSYRIVASAPGHVDFVKKVQVAADTEEIAIEIPPLERSVEAGGERPVRAIAGMATAGAGVVALGVGLAFGVKARSTWSDVEALCGTDHACENRIDHERAEGLVGDARRAGNVSTVLVGVGAVTVAAGVVLWITAPDRRDGDERAALRLVPQLGAGSAGIVAAGVF